MGIECANCHDPLGVEAGQMPFIDNDNPAKPEHWCPQCFVFVRAARDPGRYHAASFSAVYCGYCKVRSIDPGHGMCGCCGKPRNLVALGPKNLPTADDVRIITGALETARDKLRAS